MFTGKNLLLMVHHDKPWLFLLLFIAITYIAVNSAIWWIFKVLGGLGLSLGAAYFSSEFLCNRLPLRKVSTEGKAVLITGCDSGFGHLLAKRLDRLGFQIFAGCLFPKGEGAEKLRATGSDGMHIIPIDVTMPESVASAVRYLKENLGSNCLWAVVNNAGVSCSADIPWCNEETFKKVFEVNTLGVVRVTRAVLPLLHASKGRVVVMASIFGHVTAENVSPYCMSKHAVRSFSEGLRKEIRNWEIGVVTIEPGFHRTNMIATVCSGDDVQRTWDAAPEEIRTLYPDNYIQEYLEDVRQLPKYFSPHLHNVVDCLEEAVYAVHPRTQYRPCMWKELLAVLLNMLVPNAICHNFPMNTGARSNPFVAVDEFLGVSAWKKCDKCNEEY